MRVPTRKPGKYARVKTDLRITELKYKELQKKLQKLKAKQPDLIREVQTLATSGDFSENAGYQATKWQLRGLNQRILKTKYRLNGAIIIKPKQNSSIVQLGNSVTIELEDTIKIYKILGSTETNPSAGIISSNSPIGSALIGRCVGDCLKIQLTKKK